MGTGTTRVREAWRRAAEAFQLRVAQAEALPQLALLGLLCGVLAGALMVAFRFAIESTQASFLPGGIPEAYEALGAATRLLLPLAGGLAIGLLLQAMPPAGRDTGTVHVMERLAWHGGRLPLRNAIVQFVGAAASIVCGHSVGREGPAIHLGAACGSLAGQRLGLPNNGLRVLAGCGVAAAIAASFNTPLAGVVFAMEVVLMEYTVVGFAPVILAAVSATAVTRLAYGAAPAFAVPAMTLGSLWELPYVLAMGLAIGVLAAGFIALLGAVATRSARLPIWLRCTLAGAIVGLCALPAPEIMGIGYDTVNEALLGRVALAALFALLAFKLVATAAGIGLGLPGGLIGPVLVIGAAAGGALGIVGQWAAPTHASSAGFYALIGMGAMMGGALHAPLAALTAMLELTANPNIIWPEMLAVIAAYGVSRVVFRQQSVFLTLLAARGLSLRVDPLAQSLRRVGVGAAMDRRFAMLPRRAARARAAEALGASPRWVLVHDDVRPVALLAASALAEHLASLAEDAEVDLLALPAGHVRVLPIAMQASLQEALEALEAGDAGALYVLRRTVPGIEQAYGVLTRADIERHARQG